MTEKEKIRVGKDGILYIRKNGERYFSKKIYRKMTQREPGLYEFSDSDEDLEAGESCEPVFHPDTSPFTWKGLLPNITPTGM